MRVRLSVWNNSAHTGWIFVKFCIWWSLKNLCRKFKFHQNPPRITGTWHERLCKYMMTICSVPFRMRNVPDKSCRENQNTHFVFNKFFPEVRAVYEIMWKIYGRTRQATGGNIIRHMRITCRINKATDTQWRTEKGVWGVQTPPPKFWRPSKIMPNSTRLWKLLKIA